MKSWRESISWSITVCITLLYRNRSWYTRPQPTLYSHRGLQMIRYNEMFENATGRGVLKEEENAIWTGSLSLTQSLKKNKQKADNSVHDTDKSSSVFVLVVFMWSFKSLHVAEETPSCSPGCVLGTHIPTKSWNSLHICLHTAHQKYKQLINISSFWHLKIKSAFFSLHNPTKRAIWKFL